MKPQTVRFDRHGYSRITFRAEPQERDAGTRNEAAGAGG